MTNSIIVGWVIEYILLWLSPSFG